MKRRDRFACPFEQGFQVSPFPKTSQSNSNPWSLSPTLVAVHGVDDDFHTKSHGVLELGIPCLPLRVSFLRYDSATLLHRCTALQLHSPGIIPTSEVLHRELQHLTPVLDCSFQACGLKWFLGLAFRNHSGHTTAVE